MEKEKDMFIVSEGEKLTGTKNEKLTGIEYVKLTLCDLIIDSKTFCGEKVPEGKKVYCSITTYMACRHKSYNNFQNLE